MLRPSTGLAVLRGILAEVRANNVPFMAGSLAYAAFVSVLPLLLLALLVASAVGGRALTLTLLSAVLGSIAPAGAQLLTQATSEAAARPGLSVIGVVVLLWGVLRVFRGLDTAFSVLYGTGADNDLRNQVRDGAVVLAAVGVALLVASAAWLALDGVLGPRLPDRLDPLGLALGLAVVLLPVYYVFPDADVSLGEIAPGAVLTAVGWVGLEAAYEVYVTYSATADLYGLLGSVVLLITWFYVAALVVLLGAVVNVVVAGRGTTSAGHDVSA